MQNFIIIFLLICCIVLLYLIIFKKYKIKTINENIKKENDKLETKKIIKEEELKNIEHEIEINKKTLQDIQKLTKDMNITAQTAFTQYCDNLDKIYIDTEKEHDSAINLLKLSYDNLQDTLLLKIKETQQDLDNLSSTRAAAIEAQLKEEEVQQKENFYSLTIEEIDKREVKILQSIEEELRDSRPIRMIIWQAYYSKKANDLASRVLGPNEKCGIYKITNKKNKMCYIGQAKKIRERWREHMKCGLGIDTPANNKLYQAMKKEGIDNFTFEILEECSPLLLNEKEAFYINLYDSYHFGYNSNSGIKKS